MAGNDAAASRSHRVLRKLTLATALGMALDGFDLGIISVVVSPAAAELQMSTWMLGLIGASSLLGIFIGAPIFGWLTDRFGRRLLYLIDLVIFVAAGFLQGLAPNAEILFLFRFILGIAIGAEYSIGSPMLAEFAPAHNRGKRLSSLEASWYVGFLVSVITGYSLQALGVGWRWILMTSVVPALITLWLRHDMPESPRWLLSHGRKADAHKVVEKYFGDLEYFHQEGMSNERPAQQSILKLFRKEYRSKTIFTCVFWATLVTPYFAIVTFTPMVMDALGVTDARASTITVNAVAAAGAVVGVFMIERIGRRKMLLIPFWIQIAALVAIGVWVDAPPWLVVVGFALFTFFNAYACDLCGVYPSEVFPTEVRGLGVGVASAASRIGAALGVWLLPVALDTIGVQASMLLAAAICVAGAVVSHILAPETTGVALTVTSAGRRG